MRLFKILWCKVLFINCVIYASNMPAELSRGEAIGWRVGLTMVAVGLWGLNELMVVKQIGSPRKSPAKIVP